MFQWKEDFSCNVNKIDKQHKTLLELGAKLHDIIKLKDGIDHYDEIMVILTELKDYTIYHFAAEEKLLEDNGYDSFELQLHKRQHKSFINKIKQFENQDIDEKQIVITLDMLTFIANWIEQHILKIDQNYSSFLNKKGIF
ncbi:bacteriohemerythrin [Clostridiaceae bacterium 35-E11]